MHRSTPPSDVPPSDVRPSVVTALLGEAAAMVPDLIALRRAVHRDPEIGLDLPRTRRRVLDALDGTDLELVLGSRTTSVVGVLRGDLPGPTVLLRADMDALPGHEASGEPFAAENGAMHACGHDLHTAGLVGAARLLARRRATLAGTVVLMFQPGEEFDDGAAVMIDEGVLDVSGEHPVAAFAAHVGPGPRGLVMVRPGPIMAGASALTIEVHGTGGHASMPAAAVDPVPPLVEIAGALRTLSHSLDPFDPVVLTVTRLEASDAINVIPDSARLAASVRTLSTAAVEAVRTRATRLADGIAAAHGCTATVELRVEYPVTVNDAARTADAIAALRELWGTDRVLELDRPLMGSEDFATVLGRVPGTYFVLCASPADLAVGEIAANHSPRVRFDDSVLGDLAASLAWLALDALRRAGPSVTS